ncbi:MAG: hypothetical protein KC592_11965 [Nitrospira sp.]|nr:hypothetical protein [Nitrospira sp.]
MTDELLQIELRLLIHRYGKQRILSLLARIGEQTLAELEQQIRELEGKRKVKAPKPSIIDRAISEGRQHPELAESLRALAVRFQNRTFLPNLRVVQRVLDQVEHTKGKLKSREAAVPLLIRSLTKLTPDELKLLLAQHNMPGESDYSLLARAIMGKSTSER